MPIINEDEPGDIGVPIWWDIFLGMGWILVMVLFCLRLTGNL